MILRFGRLGLSDLFGYLSIASWLGAQFPQVVKNYRLQSCEGLSLPFLVTWLFGDATNLIGCILTDQLPFQTWLAGYFCLVDLSLLFQYHYYRGRPIPHEHSAITTPYIGVPRLSQSLILPSRDHSVIRTTSRPPDTASTVRPHHRRSQSLLYHISSPRTAHDPNAIIEEPYDEMYAAALDVARAAERANRTHTARGRLTRENTATTAASDLEDTPALMGDSMYSERSAKSTSTAGSKRISASTGALPDGRGRNMQRTGLGTLPTMTEQDPEAMVRGVIGSTSRERPARDPSRSLSLVRGSGGRGKGRRAAGVAFMTFGLLFMLTGTSHSPHPSKPMVVSSSSLTPATPAENLVHWSGSTSDGTHHNTYLTFLDLDTDRPIPHPPPSPPTSQRVIGRISAWICTTLYLTSRLPQIWKNFTRHSVEGLSIYLFLFAFFGNTFYVLSIVINPAGSADPSEADHYLLEALPYLLGSGGTLAFDLTIMIQSYIYGSSPPVPALTYDHFRRYHPGRRKLRHQEEGRDLSSSVISERQPLLSGSLGSVDPRSRSLSPDVAMRAHRTTSAPGQKRTNT